LDIFGVDADSSLHITYTQLFVQLLWCRWTFIFAGFFNADKSWFLHTTKQIMQCCGAVGHLFLATFYRMQYEMQTLEVPQRFRSPKFRQKTTLHCV
jgi:hypothetical protein